jgi:hypothetical protein
VKRVGDLLGAMLPPSSGAESLLPILRVWPEAVGAPVAREAWPARMGQDGTLVVHVTSSLWASELQMLSELLREKLATALAGPAPQLRFRVGPVPHPAAQPVVPPPPQAAVEAAERLSAQVADGPLRTAIQAALERALVRSGDPPDSA